MGFVITFAGPPFRALSGRIESMAENVHHQYAFSLFLILHQEYVMNLPKFLARSPKTFKPETQILDPKPCTFHHWNPNVVNF